MKAFFILLAVLGVGIVSFAAGNVHGKRFSDVPPDHWAAGAVQQMTDEGIMSGYPDSTFRGDKPVTRYELAVALARYAEFIEGSKKPLVPSKDSKQSKAVSKNCPKWAKNSVDYLTSNLFLPADSPIIVDGAKYATAEDLAQALSSFTTTYVKRNIKDSGPSEE